MHYVKLEGMHNTDVVMVLGLEQDEILFHMSWQVVLQAIDHTSLRLG